LSGLFVAGYHMIRSSVLWENPLYGTKAFWHFDDVTGLAHIETTYDAEQLIETNVAEMNEHTSLDRWGDGRRVARIPMHIVSELRRRGILDDPVRFAKWLNDPDHRKFRTRPGRISLKIN
jgi:hypothetical protein